MIVPSYPTAISVRLPANIAKCLIELVAGDLLPATVSSFNWHLKQENYRHTNFDCIMTRAVQQLQPSIEKSKSSSGAMLQLLFDLGISSPSSLVETGLRVFPSSSRHTNYRLEKGNGSGWFIKRGDHRNGFGTVMHEHRSYQLLSDICQPDLPVSIPDLVHYDPETDLLILAIVAGATDLAKIAIQGESLDEHSANLGSALATLHTIDISAADGNAIPIHDARSLFQFDAPPIQSYSKFSRAQIELIKVLQGHPPLLKALGKLTSDWRNDNLIHFDLRLANVLAGEMGVTLIDLEYLGIGDARWDIAAIFSGFLETWLVSAPLGDPDGFDCHLDHAVFSGENARSAISNVWAGYSQSGNASTMQLEDITRFTGAKLIKSAFEHAAEISEPNARVATLAAIGMELLENPRQAACQRLGFCPQELRQ